MPDAANFAQRVKAWRKEKGLSQRQLAGLLGISRIAVSNWERGKNILSSETADKLMSMGFQPDITLFKRRKPCCYDEPLNDEERRFAELHHDSVYRFLRLRRLPYNDWYDVVVFGYLRAVKMWFARPELHKYAFSAIAYNTMRTAVGNERRKQKRRPEYRAVSLDNVIPGTENFTYADILCDPRDCVGI